MNPSIEEVLKACHAKDLITVPIGGGKHEGLCPFHKLETHGAGKTIIYLPNEKYKNVVIKCFDPGCAGRVPADYLEALGLSTEPVITLPFPEIPSLDTLKATEDEIQKARAAPRCIVTTYRYADVALVNAEGGVGKTTLLLYESVLIALGMPLYGLEVESPGATLFVTSEDSREILLARIRYIMEALDLSPEAREIVLKNLHIWDVRGELCRLAEQDTSGNIVFTGLADHIIERFKGVTLAQVIFDPTASFGAGERFVNDNDNALVNAARRISDGLKCYVIYIHHISKAAARAGKLDQYASRSGTALPNGARMVTGLRRWDEATKRFCCVNF